jgi:hypothetical protein
MIAASRRLSCCSEVLEIKGIKELARAEEYKSSLFVRERQVVFSLYMFYFILCNFMIINFIFYDIA